MARGWTWLVMLCLLCPTVLPAQLKDSLATFFPHQAAENTGVTLDEMQEVYRLIASQLGQNLILEQVCPLDQLQSELSSSKVDLAYWLDRSFDLRRFGQMDCSVQLLQELRTYAEAYSLEEKVILESHLALTWSEYLGDYQIALQHAEAAMDLVQGEDEGAAWAHYTLGRIQHRLAEFAPAYQHTQQSLALARNLGIQTLAAKSLGSLALINRDVFFGETLKAVDFHEGAIEIAEAIADTSILLHERLYLAANYGEAGQHPTYLELIQNVTNMASTFKDVRMEEKILISYGAFLSSKGLYREAEHLFNLALDLAREINKRSIIGHLHYQLFEIHLMQGDLEEAQQILSAGLSEGVLDSALIQQQLYAMERLRGDRARALEHLESAYNAVKGQYMDRNAAMLSFWETQLNTQESRLELEQQRTRLEAEQQQRLLYTYLLVAVGLLLMMAIYGFYYQRKSSRKLQKQTLQIQKQAEELKHLDDLKSRFFTNVSHELRTPLSLILGPIRSILSHNSLTEEERHLLSMADKNGTQLNQLVNEILDFSKLESQRVEIQESPVNLYLFLQQLTDRFEYLKHSRNIDFTFDFQGDKEIKVELDQHKFEKVINNLLSNAFKFTPPGGKIKFRQIDEEDSLLFQVEDTGLGIDPKDLPNVFKRYYQAANKPTAQAGTGIGLALSYQFVKLFGGEMWAESEVGKGSLFQVRIPKKLSSFNAGSTEYAEVYTGPAIEDHRASAKVTKERNILVVEDNEDLRSYLSYILGKRYEMQMVSNGAEAVEYLEQQQKLPDLIITDLMMPIMDGFQLLAQLRSTQQYSHIPVIMLTAKTNMRDRLTALRIGIDDYLVKPFLEEELVARVDNLLRYVRPQSQVESYATEPGNLIEPHYGETIPKNQVDLEWLVELEDVILQQLGDFNLTADVIARKMLISRTQLFRKIKKLTGLTVNQYIQEMRFQEARKLLEDQKHRSVKSVALTVGFKHVKNFSQRFKDRFGRLPSSYF
ncbi:MAG: response regulator [Saprospiraceae bacterium]|nr:response regulator [Saprospiraceae bacterium]